MLGHRFIIVALGLFSVSMVWAQEGPPRPPYYPGGTRLTVASEICFGPFSPEDFDRCVKFLIEGDYNLASDVEFEVLKNFVVMANTAFDPEIGYYTVASDIEQTLELFSRVEGMRFSRDILSHCVLRYIAIGAVTYGRNDGEYLGCVQRFVSEQ